ncbi:MAG: hypothetical protein F6J89_12425 [Symploca sp. SIO1C4]|uniref:Uncharacterized protein n=1 Tax=Symploca sp. SIO1C4 TaxID=2607765 RepID=A0A6B3NGJ3_9CYAN|nr:hypothetical protein [Symploca sp. SIO1C4]
MSDLYIFVTTDRPDQYLNSIVHCIEKGTRKIVFIQVEDRQTEQVKLNLLRANVYNLLQNLSTGVYKYYTDPFKHKVVHLDAEYKTENLTKLKAKYSFCLTDGIDWTVERVPYLNLRRYISALGKRKGSIVDVTSVSKVYIGDILACCLLENIAQVYTFELLVKPDFDKPWKILIHELAEGKVYKYTNLVETPIFKESKNSILIRSIPLLVSIIGTVLFIAVTLTATFILGFNSVFIQVVSTIGTVLGIISFFLVYFPVRSK